MLIRKETSLRSVSHEHEQPTEKHHLRSCGFALHVSGHNDEASAEAMELWGIQQKWCHISVCKVGPWKSILQEFSQVTEEPELYGACVDEIVLKASCVDSAAAVGATIAPFIFIHTHVHDACVATLWR